jgi:hypothetical protein
MGSRFACLAKVGVKHHVVVDGGRRLAELRIHEVIVYENKRTLYQQLSPREHYITLPSRQKVASFRLNLLLLLLILVFHEKYCNRSAHEAISNSKAVAFKAQRAPWCLRTQRRLGMS